MKFEDGMRLHWKRSGLYLCAFIVIYLLTACGGGSTSGTTSTPTTAPSSKPSPVATAAPTFTSYTGNGYTINYPSGWKKQVETGVVIFSDNTGINGFGIYTKANPNAVISSDAFVKAIITVLSKAATKSQHLPVSSTTMVGGDTWSQEAITGTSRMAGQEQTGKFVILADNHPARSPSTRVFGIFYGTSQQMFDSMNSTYFQPMLQSFKFT